MDTTYLISVILFLVAAEYLKTYSSAKSHQHLCAFDMIINFIYYSLWRLFKGKNGFHKSTWLFLR